MFVSSALCLRAPTLTHSCRDRVTRRRRSPCGRAQSVAGRSSVRSIPRRPSMISKILSQPGPYGGGWGGAADLTSPRPPAAAIRSRPLIKLQQLSPSNILPLRASPGLLTFTPQGLLAMGGEQTNAPASLGWPRTSPSLPTPLFFSLFPSTSLLLPTYRAHNILQKRPTLPYADPAPYERRPPSYTAASRRPPP